jgi:shikimate kinase
MSVASPGGSGSSDPISRVLLIGLMGSGKTVVGRALADRVGWTFQDFDQEIKLRMGLPIPEIFLQHGEERFREVEEQVGRDLLGAAGYVLASGGGWPAFLGRMQSLPLGTLSVWLKVTPEEAVRRIREEGPTRPLLAVADPVGRARSLLEVREPFYAQAQVHLDSVGKTPGELASEIEDIMNQMGHGGSSAPQPPV